MSIEYIFDYFPDFNTISGFLFYSSGCYAVIMFLSWLAQPILDESIKEEIEVNKIKKKGMDMRRKNK